MVISPISSKPIFTVGICSRLEEDTNSDQLIIKIISTRMGKNRYI